jgi:hypothetical protein
MLQRQLVGRLVQHAAVQRQVDRVATVAAGDLLAVPVEVQVDLLRLAQAAALEVVLLRQQGVVVQRRVLCSVRLAIIMEALKLRSQVPLAFLTRLRSAVPLMGSCFQSAV